MGGGLVQVTRRGAEDGPFNGSPQLSAWRGTFRRVSNFAVETLPLTWLTQPAFGQTCSLALSRLGDLASGVVVQATVRKTSGDFTAAHYPIEALLKYVALVIDGTVVDAHTSDWARVYNGLHLSYDESEKYKRLANFEPDVVSSGDPATQTFLVPLRFSWCRSPACALPLVAMGLSDVKLHFTLADAEPLGLDPAVLDLKVYCDYVYVDVPERELLCRQRYDLLLEQVQTKTFTVPDPSPDNMTRFTVKLNMFRPVKSLYFLMRHEHDGHHGRYIGDPDTVPLALTADVSAPSGLSLVSPLPDSLAPIHTAQLFFNEHERTPPMPFAYFNRYLAQKCAGQPVPGVGVVPFGTRLEDSAPAGTANMSAVGELRLDLAVKRNASLAEPNDAESARDIGGLKTLVVMAWGYNILKVEGGRATMMFL
jgi:hypothetical protein